jgi:hypothetical protein
MNWQRCEVAAILWLDLEYYAARPLPAGLSDSVEIARGVADQTA